MVIVIPAKAGIQRWRTVPTENTYQTDTGSSIGRVLRTSFKRNRIRSAKTADNYGPEGIDARAFQSTS